MSQIMDSPIEQQMESNSPDGATPEGSREDVSNIPVPIPAAPMTMDDLCKFSESVIRQHSFLYFNIIHGSNVKIGLTADGEKQFTCWCNT